MTGSAWLGLLHSGGFNAGGRGVMAYGGAMSREDSPLIAQAADAARRLHFMARLHLARPCRRGLAREAQAMFDLLWRMGFRPAQGGDQ